MTSIPTKQDNKEAGISGELPKHSFLIHFTESKKCELYDDIEFTVVGQEINGLYYSRGRHFDYYGLQFLYSGAMEIQIGDGPKVTYHAPGYFLTYPGVAWNYGPPEGTSKNHIWICFKGARVEKYISAGLLSPCVENPFIPVRIPREVLRVMEEILLLSQDKGNPQSQLRAIWLLDGLLLDFAEERKGQSVTEQYQDEILQLRRRIITKPEVPWNFAQEARKLCISEVHFRRLFKHYVKSAPGAYLQECRLQKAQGLLAKTSLRIDEIAYQCGFGDALNLRRLLRKCSGLSPREYRETMKNI